MPAACAAPGKESQAQSVLRTAWQANPNPEIADYLMANTTDKLERVRAGATLEQANPSHPESRFLMARLSLEAGLVRDARRQLEECRRLGLAEQRVWLLQAEIEAAEHGDTEEGRLAQSRALRQAATADPDAAWTCQSCGTVHPVWHAACPICHTAGRVRWGSPARRLAAASAQPALSAPT